MSQEGLYFEDLPVGTELRMTARTIAALFSQRIAHGLMSLSVLQGLKTAQPPSRSMG